MTQREESLRKLSSEAYKNHTLIEQGNGRWTIRSPGTSIYWQTFLTAPYRLVIVGDGPDLIFNAGNRPPRSMVAWLGSSNEDYLAEKVLAPQSGWTWDETEALIEVRETITSYIDQGYETVDKTVSGLEQILQDYSQGDGEYEFWRLAHEYVSDVYEYNFGRVPLSGIYYARAAAARLCELLPTSVEP